MGTGLSPNEKGIYQTNLAQLNVDVALSDPTLSVAGEKFLAYGIKSYRCRVVWWGCHLVKGITPAPSRVRTYDITAGDYLRSSC